MKKFPFYGRFIDVAAVLCVVLSLSFITPACMGQEEMPASSSAITVSAVAVPMSHFIPGERDSVVTPSTKVAPGGMVSSFRAWGYLWPGSSSQGAPSWFVDETFSQSGLYWVSSAIHGAIPDGYYGRIWGVGPADATGLSGLPSAGVSATPSFSYTVPAAAASQSDLVVAYSLPQASSGSAFSMSFEHIMAGLQFTTNGVYVPPYTIKGISVSNVKNSGVYTQGSGWGSLSGSTTFSITMNQALSRTDYNTLIGGESQTMMLLPQTLPAGSTLTVTLDRGAGNENVTASLSGVQLRQGYVTVIRLNLPEEDAVDLSYRTYAGAVSAARNTANCYVVRSGGIYEIPLVYGNAIKAGATNSAAYMRQGSDYTADFVNHLGNTLTSPYIESNSGCSAGSAGLLWQTHAGMVTSVALMDGAPCRKLRIQVNAVPPENGIAVVYVKDAYGDIMWSWTLWMTTDNLAPESQTNYQGVTYQMMPEGLCTIWDAGRTRCRNAYYQWGRKDPMPPSAAYNSNGNCALYTISGAAYSGFGSYGVANDSDAGGTVRSVANAIKMPEKFFLYYDSSSYSWNNLPWMNNFWNAAMTASSSLADDQASAIKTIYDPCPAGWMLPSGRAWTGFTTTGSNTSTSSEWNVVGSFANGWTFKKTAVDAVGTYYPASGCRNDGSGGLGSVGSNGYWWSYAPNSQANARRLGFTSGYVHPLYNSNRADGFSVRPSLEQ